MGMSAISSRKTVPPSAASSLPILRAYAPVKAPFSWPNSSLSSRPSGMPAQLMATNGLSARRLWEWMLRATSSLPVPLSPRISTVESVGAILRTRPSTERMAADGATTSGKSAWASMRPSASVTQFRAWAMGATASKSVARRRATGGGAGTKARVSRRKVSTGRKISHRMNSPHRKAAATSRPAVPSRGQSWPPATRTEERIRW